MRLVTYDRGGARRLGAWVGDTVVDVPDAVGHPAFPTTLEALVARCGGTTLDAARDALDCPAYLEGCFVDTPRLLAPFIPARLSESRRIVGPEEELPWPPAEELDYGLELACIVARDCRDVAPADARRVIFGYTLMNDWTARGRIRPGSPLPGADRFATSLGPCVVTADEFDPSRGWLIARVNGELWSEWDLSLAEATFADVIADASHDRQLYAGDILGSGTFPGGCALDLGRHLPSGALVELEVAGIGVLRNRLGAAGG